uniref:WAP four-disulfide core domain 1 n=1 Tax=Ursus maritimus TaxID=29073 RepID=A0A452UL47_URSMA
MISATRRGVGSGRRKVIWALCFLLLLLEAGSAKNLWKRALHTRLAEKSYVSAWEGEVGRGAPRWQRVFQVSPTPPGPLPSRSWPREYVSWRHGTSAVWMQCAPERQVLDWLVQPKPRWLGGNGWLLDGPEEVLQAEACSTTEDGAEPLLCPSGYECHILSPGDVAEGIPNRGQCVKQRRQAGECGRPSRAPEGDSKNVAEPGKGPQRHFQ